MIQVSIVIPTLNEAASLERTLRCLSILNPPAWEIWLVDGGSQDETVEIAQRMGAKVLHSEQRGRSPQMNLGAEYATGDYLCFLHADTLVPDDLVSLIEHTLSNPRIACGGFISLMSGAERTRWIISLHNCLKTYYAALIFRPHLFARGLRVLFGDQVMFCRRKQFREAGGFDTTLPIMEDADLCRKLLRFGSIRQINRVVVSSDRRVARWGFWKANAIYLLIGCLWGMGVSATTLKKFYDDVR